MYYQFTEQGWQTKPGAPYPGLWCGRRPGEKSNYRTQATWAGVFRDRRLPVPVQNGSYLPALPGAWWGNCAWTTISGVGGGGNSDYDMEWPSWPWATNGRRRTESGATLTRDWAGGGNQFR